MSPKLSYLGSRTLATCGHPHAPHPLLQQQIWKISSQERSVLAVLLPFPVRAWTQASCLELIFQARVNYLPVLATKPCVIQNINLKYRSNQTSPADAIYALQIERQIKGWFIIIPTQCFLPRERRREAVLPGDWGLMEIHRRTWADLKTESCLCTWTVLGWYLCSARGAVPVFCLFCPLFTSACAPEGNQVIPKKSACQK